MMKKSLTNTFLMTAFALAFFAVGAVVFASAQDMKQKSLYERLGGYNAIAAVTDDLIGRLVNDKKLGRYFVGLSTDSKKKLRQHLIDFLCAATGGPCIYTGRDMKTSHEGLGISEEDWEIAVKHLKDTLNKFKVPEKEQSEVFAAVGSTKKDIVEKQ